MPGPRPPYRSRHVSRETSNGTPLRSPVNCPGENPDEHVLESPQAGAYHTKLVQMVSLLGLIVDYTTKYGILDAIRTHPVYISDISMTHYTTT